MPEQSLFDRPDPARLIRPLGNDSAEYLRDESRSLGFAETISFPRTEAELCAVVRHQAEAGGQITVQGSRTGLTAGAVPNGGHILNMSRLNRIRGLRQSDDGSWHIRVEAGLTLARLRQQIAERRFDRTGWDEAACLAADRFAHAPAQFFPTDPTETTASLGGMAACNASGARSYRYGPMRAHISSLRVVLTDGQTLALQRGQVFARGRSICLVTEQGAQFTLHLPAYDLPQTKSAAGYFAAADMDALDLFIGSDGTLGILSELELRLQPLPPLIWSVTCFFAEPAALVDFVVRVRQALPDDIIALEYFDAHVLDLLRRQKEQNPAYARLLAPPPRFQGAVCAELAAADEATALSVLDHLGNLVTQAGGRDDETWVARTAFDQDQLVFFRHAAPESVNQIIDQRRRSHPGLTKLGTDMSVPDDCLGQILDLYRHDLAACGLESATWGHIGDNHVHVNILPRDQADYLAGQALYRSWAERVVAWGGSVAAEHGIGKLKRALLHLMFGPAAIAEMRAVKQVLDPQGRLGAGNLFLDPEAKS